MKKNKTEHIACNKAFFMVAVTTLFLLAIPFLLMKYEIPLYDPGSGYEVINWDPTDFIVMGIMISGTTSLFILAAKKIQKRVHKIALAGLFFFGFLWLWAELAVGIFTHWGN